MGNKFIDLTGQRFGRLTVISRAKNDVCGNTMWNCWCDCGKPAVVLAGQLRRGHSKSCGCLNKELAHERNKKHGMYNSRLYRIWHSMRSRCNNSNVPSYKYYGARNIKVCDEWLDEKYGFETFFKWAIGNGYSDNLSIDRIDNDKGYSPENSRWATPQEQSENRRCIKPFVWEGVEYKTMAECGRQLGINPKTLRNRAKKERDKNGD